MVEPTGRIPLNTTLYTIGYQGRTPEDFLGILRAGGVDALVDVRDVPWSHKPGFAKAALQEFLASNGVEYLHAKFAGNPKALRSGSTSVADALERYRDHLASHPEIVASFVDLVEDLHRKGRSVAILCFERDPAECHRGILAAEWQKSTGGPVQHLGT